MYVITLGVIRSRVGSFIPGKCSKIWGAAISLGHVYIVKRHLRNISYILGKRTCA